MQKPVGVEPAGFFVLKCDVLQDCNIPISKENMLGTFRIFQLCMLLYNSIIQNFQYVSCSLSYGIIDSVMDRK